MERLLNRLRWTNLPLRAKTAAVFVLQILLILAFAATAYSALDSVRIAVENTLTNVVTARTQAKDIEIKVEGLADLQTDIATAYLNPNFDPATAGTVAVYNNRVLDIKTTVGNLQVVRVNLRGPVPDSVTTITFADFNQNLDKAQERYIDTFNNVQQLTDKQSGALLLLEQRGTEFEATTLLTGSLPLVLRMAAIRTLESSLLTSHSAEDQDALLDAIDDYMTNFALEVPASTLGQTQRLADAYTDQIRGTGDLLRRLDRANAVAEVQLTLLRNTGNRLSSLIEAQTSSPLDTVALILDQARLTLILGLLLALAGGIAITVVFSRSLGKSMDVLINAARQLEQGNLKSRASVLGTDEFSVLGASFNAMSVQIEGLVGGLEQRVAERTRDLSITAEIGRAVVALRDPRELMNEIVELIRSRFGYYHAQIFLVDEHRENAVLVASTGTAGRELLSRGHFIEVGSRSVIGQVTGSGEPVIAVDTDSGGVHRRNELLPDTRSEMALPMRIGDQIIGALDVQSVAPNAFSEDVVVVFQTMADELAIALENARIRNDLHEAQENLVSLERRLTADSWRTYQEGRSADAPAAFQYSDGSLTPVATSLSETLDEAMQAGQAMTFADTDAESELAVPIKVRGEVIGAFGFGGEALQNLSADDIALVEAVVDRVGLALENIRLVEQTSRRAEHEQIVNEITAKIVGSTDVNHILQTTVKELGRVLRAPQTSVQLRREKAE